MSQNRKLIINVMDQPGNPTGYYEALKCCLYTKDDVNKMDQWFSGVIRSLYYHPNESLLALVGNEKLGLDSFFRWLLPEEIDRFYYQALAFNDEAKYNRLIVDMAMRTSVTKMIREHNFVVTDKGSDKRLASICTTYTKEWTFGKTKNLLVLKIDEVDWLAYNDINKLLLWNEIFKIFKP